MTWPTWEQLNSYRQTFTMLRVCRLNLIFAKCTGNVYTNIKCTKECFFVIYLFLYLEFLHCILWIVSIVISYIYNKWCFEKEKWFINFQGKEKGWGLLSGRLCKEERQADAEGNKRLGAEVSDSIFLMAMYLIVYVMAGAGCSENSTPFLSRHICLLLGVWSNMRPRDRGSPPSHKLWGDSFTWKLNS